MASLTDTLTGLKNKPETSGSTQQRYPVQYINYACLEASAYNFYPVFSLRPDIGRRLKTCRFDLAVKKKSREKLCPIRTRAAKKVIKEGVCNEYLHSWDQRKRYKVT